MSHAPPIPEANQSPYPRHDPPILHHELPPRVEASPSPTETIAALPGRAVTAAKGRPWAAAAVVGALVLALIGGLRRKRS
jgi:hypothetical protein